MSKKLPKAKCKYCTHCIAITGWDLTWQIICERRPRIDGCDSRSEMAKPLRCAYYQEKVEVKNG